MFTDAGVKSYNIVFAKESKDKFDHPDTEVTVEKEEVVDGVKYIDKKLKLKVDHKTSYDFRRYRVEKDGTETRVPYGD